MNSLDQRPYFFDAGIRFTCRRCGACCTGEPGIVRVGTNEIDRMADFLDLPVSQMIADYLTVWEGGYRVREADDGRCLFFEGGCRIYSVRPRQCRTFPFWFTNLRSEWRWQSIVKECPGIGAGRLYSRDRILDILNADD